MSYSQLCLLYSEFIFRETLEGLNDDININGDVRYAYGTLIFANDIVSFNEYRIEYSKPVRDLKRKQRLR